MSRLKARIVELEAELGPLLAKHRMALISEALRRLNAMGLEAAVLSVGSQGVPVPRDGALDFFVRACPAEKRAEISRTLDELSDEHAWLFLHDDGEVAIESAFADRHFEWSEAEQEAVVRPA